MNARSLKAWLCRRHEAGGSLAVRKPSCFLTRQLFVRLLAVVYFVAFASLRTQIVGLVGKNGIAPLAQRLDAIRTQAGAERYWWIPTVCWWNASDEFLAGLCTTGAVLSVALVAGVAPGPMLLILWLLYLSLASAGQLFLSFQWDALLLETGLLAIFFAPWRLWWKPWGIQRPPSLIVLWLLRWLLFRLMFLSGITKLSYHDPTWCGFTALCHHYETQPLPTWVGWYAHQLPCGMQQFCCGAMFFIEVLVPFLIFGPRRARYVACALLVFLQVLIAATGNYGFFNLLAIVLCVPLLDDAVLRRSLPKGMRAGSEPPTPVGGVVAGVNARASCSAPAGGVLSSPTPVGGELPTGSVAARGRHPSLAGGVLTGSRRWRAVPAGLLALVVVPISIFAGVREIFGHSDLPEPAMQVLMWTSPLRSINGYGLFRVMTTTRPEIVIEGSRDGHTWLPYEFKWKPGDLARRPRFNQPHQPRLDWQMWFAALGNVRANPWVVQFMVHLLEGSPEVLALLEKNPFPDSPPRYVRAVRYLYHFTDRPTRRETGDWWRREPMDTYCPPVSLRAR